MSAQSNIKEYIRLIDKKLSAMPDNQLLQYGKKLLEDRKRASESLVDRTDVSFDVLRRFLGVVNNKLDGMPSEQVYKFGYELIDTRASLMENLESSSEVTLQSISTMKDGQVLVNIADTIVPIYIRDGSWLIGRGREDWQWDNKGKGSALDLLNHGNPSAFVPAYYSADTINMALTLSGLDLEECEVVLRRAGNPDGSYYYNTVLNLDKSLWSWEFSTRPYINVNYYEINDPRSEYYVREYSVASDEIPDILGINDEGVNVVYNDRVIHMRNYHRFPGAGNTQYRWYTSPYKAHGSTSGFMGGAYQNRLPDGSYPNDGTRSNNWGSSDPDNFGYRGETVAYTVPYTEVYLRIKR